MHLTINLALPTVDFEHWQSLALARPSPGSGLVTDGRILRWFCGIADSSSRAVDFVPRRVSQLALYLCRNNRQLTTIWTEESGAKRSASSSMNEKYMHENIPRPQSLRESDFLPCAAERSSSSSCTWGKTRTSKASAHERNLRDKERNTCQNDQRQI